MMHRYLENVRVLRWPARADGVLIYELLSWMRLATFCVGGIALFGGIIAIAEPTLELFSFR
jgi:hypothetical protein